MRRFVFLTLALLLVGCGRRFNYPSRDLSPPIPAYPNAPDSGLGREYDRRNSIFDTTDAPDAVFRFSDEQLPKQERNGWRPYSGAVQGHARTYAAIGCGCSYFLTVDAVANGQGTNRVTLRLWGEMWCH